MADDRAPVPPQGTRCPLTAWSNWGRNTEFGKVIFFLDSRDWVRVSHLFPPGRPSHSQPGLLGCQGLHTPTNPWPGSNLSHLYHIYIYMTYIYAYIFYMMCVTRGEIQLCRAAGRLWGAGQGPWLAPPLLREGGPRAWLRPGCCREGTTATSGEQSRVKMIPKWGNRAQGLWGSGTDSGSLFRAWF